MADKGKVTPMKPATQPQLDTIKSLESIFTVGPSAWQRVNPDKLVRLKGLQIYAEMRLDDQVKAATTFKRDAIVARGWTLSYDDESKLAPEEQKRRIDLITAIIDAYPGSFVDVLNSVALGRDYGFSLVEKVFTSVPIQGYGNAIGLSTLRWRDPRTFEFVTDGFGTLTKDGFRQRAGGQLTVLDLNDFIYYVHAPENDPYYGSSDLRAAYKYWYAKQVIQDYWLIFMERLAGGFPVLTAKDSTAPRAGTSEYAAMQTVLANLKSSAGILVPNGMEFKLESINDSDSFEKAITFFDLGIARSMLVPNLLGASHTGHSSGGQAGSGAGSQSGTQLETFYWTLQEDQQRLEATLNEQLFKPLARFNFPDGDGPCFEFKPLSEERLRWLVQTWAVLITGNAVVATEEDENYLRSLMGMPARDADAVPLVTTAQKMAQDQAQAALDAKSQQAQDVQQQQQDQQKQDAAKMARLEAQITELTAKFASPQPVTVNVSSPSPVAADHHASQASHHASPSTEGEGHVHIHAQPQNVAAFTHAVKRVMFGAIEQKQMATVATIANDAAAQVAKSVAKAANDARIGKALADPARIPDMALSVEDKGKLKGVIKSGLMHSYIDGVSMARNEIQRSGAEAPAPSAERASFGSVRNVAADYIDANGFRIAGNVSDATRSVMQQEMLNGVKAGSSAAEIRTAIWNRLVAKGMTSEEAVRGVETDEGVLAALDALWVDSESAGMAYLNTLVRTNTFDAFNEGRYAEFTDPALGGFVQALEYSAVLDDKTTEICSSLDGTVWDSDNPLWDSYRPPNHFNCRSILVAVTELDVQRGEWDGTESPPPNVEPADGFGAGGK